jgi:hypothetical protein
VLEVVAVAATSSISILPRLSRGAWAVSGAGQSAVAAVDH